MIPRSRIQKIHFIGIGGAGMSGIAEILNSQGFKVSGSDAKESDVTSYLSKIGVKLHIGHSSENVNDADLIVYSSAVKSDNVEIVEGKRKLIPIIRRAEMLGELMRLKYTLAVSGTHGKTTTTSLLGHIWNVADLHPTIIVGGIVKSMQSGAQFGKGDALIAEADEYDKSFLEMVPTLTIITNVDEDHLDCYKDLNEIKDAFVTFANKVPFYGFVLACVDEPGVQAILPRIKKPLVTYGFSRQADYRIEEYSSLNGVSKFTVVNKDKVLGDIVLHIPGRHNAKNALGALAMAIEEGIAFDVVQKALESFTGVKRRFEYLGESNNNFKVYDDYAHHPAEVTATLQGAREAFPKYKLVVAFQPHLYSRTQDQLETFASAFLNCDSLVLLPIYGAREAPIKGITSTLLAEESIKRGHRQVGVVSGFNDALVQVREWADENTIVLVMGAGSVWKLLTPLVSGGFLND